MTSAREAIHNLLDILLESPGTFSNLGENHGAHATTSEVELDSQIKKLLKISEAINKTIDHQLKVLHQRRNQSFSPLYRLPNEIIARIFEEALIQRQQSHFDSKLLLHDLGSISQRCRQVVMSHPTLWDTVSEEVGQNFRFEASIDTCKELEITSDDERLVTFYGFHCGQRGPTTCHIRACKKRDFKQVLTSFLEGPLAPYNFSGLRSLTFCGTRYTKPMPSVYATFLYDLHALETLALYIVSSVMSVVTPKVVGLRSVAQDWRA
ncbi:hypothetical protein FRC02_008472 [Tulasnella sp. 418]|nr:hypothetical protein FRC02_008472 [Tulasnella sp. 418]